MTILLAAVDCGSLSAASRQLGLPLATVSRRVAELEDHLKIRLLLRGSRKLTLTNSGRSYVASCRRILDDISDAERTAAGEYLSPRGELTISVSQIMGRVHVMPVVEEFMRAFPDVRMRVLLNDRRVDLIEEDAVEPCIPRRPPSHSSMIALRVGHFRRVVCAGPCIPGCLWRAERSPHDWPRMTVSHTIAPSYPGAAGRFLGVRRKATFEKVQSVSVLSSIRSKPPRVLQLPGLALSGCPHISPTISLGRVCS